VAFVCDWTNPPPIKNLFQLVYMFFKVHITSRPFNKEATAEDSCFESGEHHPQPQTGEVRQPECSTQGIFQSQSLT